MRTRITIEVDEPCLVTVVPLPPPSRPGPRKTQVTTGEEISSDPPSSACFRAAPVVWLRKSA